MTLQIHKKCVESNILMNLLFYNMNMYNYFKRRKLLAYAYLFKLIVLFSQIHSSSWKFEHKTKTREACTAIQIIFLETYPQ